MKKIILLGLALWINMAHASSYHPLLCILVGPSGVGKSTLVREILQRCPDMEQLVTSTTRSPRPGEINGQDYHFITPQQFMDHMQRNEVLLPEQVYGNWYGPLKSSITSAFARQHNLICCITGDIALKLKDVVAADVITIFIQPPSIQELEQRLSKRGTESAASLQRRLASAQSEIQLAGHYDYIITNDHLANAVQELLIIVNQVKQRQTEKSDI